jgi:hypothetical protein
MTVTPPWLSSENIPRFLAEVRAAVTTCFRSDRSVEWKHPVQAFWGPVVPSPLGSQFPNLQRYATFETQVQ